MADNVAITAGSGTSIAADDITSVFYQRVKLSLGADGTAVDAVAGAGAVGTGVQRVTLASDDPLVVSGQLLDDTVFTDDAAFTPGTSKGLAVGFQADETSPDSVDEGDFGVPRMTLTRYIITSPRLDPFTVDLQITRPANTTTYAVNDALADTTPTSGGFTFTGMARISGGAGFISDAVFSFEEDAATPLQGELWLFDQSVTAVADNAAFVISDAEARTLVGIIPFVLTDGGNNGIHHVERVNMPYTCSGSANLRALVRAKNAYVPTTNSSILTCRLKGFWTN